MSSSARNGSSRRSRALSVQTQAAQAPGLPKAPLLPHEHDESPELSSASPQSVEVQAHADLARGLVETDRREDATRVFNDHPRNKARGVRR